MTAEECYAAVQDALRSALAAAQSAQSALIAAKDAAAAAAQTIADAAAQGLDTVTDAGCQAARAAADAARLAADAACRAAQAAAQAAKDAAAALRKFVGFPPERPTLPDEADAAADDLDKMGGYTSGTDGWDRYSGTKKSDKYDRARARKTAAIKTVIMNQFSMIVRNCPSDPYGGVFGVWEHKTRYLHFLRKVMIQTGWGEFFADWDIAGAFHRPESWGWQERTWELAAADPCDDVQPNRDNYDYTWREMPVQGYMPQASPYHRFFAWCREFSLAGTREQRQLGNYWYCIDDEMTVGYERRTGPPIPISIPGFPPLLFGLGLTGLGKILGLDTIGGLDNIWQSNEE
jgi:hypothetical protein